MVKQTVFAASSDESRPIFTGALLEIEENDFKLITTDTHRLALRSSKGNIIKNNNINLIIPAKALAEVSIELFKRMMKISKLKETIIKYVLKVVIPC